MGKSTTVNLDDPVENPRFYNWTMVFINYCDGSSFTGNRSETFNGLRYRGRANLDAVLDDLIATEGLRSASQVASFLLACYGGVRNHSTLPLVTRGDKCEEVIARTPSFFQLVLCGAGCVDGGQRWWACHISECRSRCESASRSSDSRSSGRWLFSRSPHTQRGAICSEHLH
eukprot:m.231086 g.231086  ORF g.231086 m.231086 type:complete len:172 (+) comp15686_c0_seq5:546-1061(+)